MIGMIRHRTFTQEKGITAQGLIEHQELARQQAEAFIAQELDEQDIISITETSLILPLSSKGLFSVTVWFKDRGKR